MPDDARGVAARDLLSEFSGLLLDGEQSTADLGTDADDALRSRAPDAAGRRLVERIEFYDPQSTVDTDGALVLVWARTSDRYDLARIVDQLSGAVVLVLPSDADVARIESLFRQVSERDVSQPRPLLVRKSQWVGWGELHSLLAKSHRALGNVPRSLPPQSSLSDLAEHLAAHSGASITIEDLDSRVLAYSSVEGAVDRIRADTILQRAVPGWRIEQMMADGFLQAVWTSDDVIERPADTGAPARMVVSVKADGETIGTIWAAYGEDSAPDELRRLLRDAARAAAPPLLREMGTSAHESRLKDEALESVLSGNGPFQPAATLLRLPLHEPYAVLAYETDAEGQCPLVDFHLSATLPGFRAIRRDGGRALLAHVSPDDDAANLAARMQEHLERVLPTEVRLRAAVGPVVRGLAAAGDSARESALVMRALRGGGTAGGGSVPVWADPEPATPSRIRVATVDDMADTVELLRIADSLRAGSARLSAALDSLEAYDDAHGTELVPTLRATLATFGNTAASAKALRIHSNSLRYRITRIRELTGIDLGEPSSRLRAEIALLVRDSSH